MCRCTGYRPIADAFKTFAKDADERLLSKLIDLEELDMIKPCGLECTKNCTHRGKCFNHHNGGDGDLSETDEDCDEFVHINDDRMLKVKAVNHHWFRAGNLDDVFEAMSEGEYMLIAGHTGQGTFYFPIKLILRYKYFGLHAPVLVICGNLWIRYLIYDREIVCSNRNPCIANVNTLLLTVFGLVVKKV